MREGTVEPNGKQIESLRTERGWSQEELATKADCSKRTIENIEAGKPVYRKTLAAIAAAFGAPVQVKDLLVANGETIDLKEVTTSSKPVVRVGNAPPLPSLLVGREGDMSRLIARLSHVESGTDTGPRQRLIIVRGWPGVGKTSITRAIAHSPDLAAMFPDGVLWTALGPSPPILAELIAWGRALGDPDLLLSRDVAEASHRLAGLLRERRMLLIVDDVWDAGHLTPFVVGGGRCATLVTTRITQVADQVAPTPDDIYRLDVLTEDESLKLLDMLAPKVVASHQAECRQLVRELEGLPLALQVAGRILRLEHDRGWSVAELLSELRESAATLLASQAPADTTAMNDGINPTVTALLNKSTDCLDAMTRRRFASLAPFAPKPALFELEDIVAVWRTDESDARRTIDILVDRGLLESLGDGDFQIHQILVQHARTLIRRRKNHE